MKFRFEIEQDCGCKFVIEEEHCEWDDNDETALLTDVFCNLLVRAGYEPIISVEQYDMEDDE